MSEQIATLKRRMEEKQAQISSALAKLIPSDYYPFVLPPLQQSDAAFHEMKDSMNSLQKDVGALFDAVGKLQATSIPLQTPVTPLAPATPSNPEAGEIASASTSRPKKRRRLSVDGSRTGEPTTNVSDPTADDFDRLQDLLIALEGRVVGVENDMRQYEDKISDEVETQLDYLGLSRHTAAGVATNAELTERVEKLKSEMLSVEQRAADVTSGLSKLKLDGQTQDERNAELQTENEKLREQVAEVRSVPLSMMLSRWLNPLRRTRSSKHTMRR